MGKNVMVACLMLDVDGVLVDGRPADGLRWDHALWDDLGVAPKALGTAFFAAHWADIVTGKKDLMPTLSRVLTQIAPHVAAVDLVDYWWANDARIRTDVLADCHAARAAGIGVFLATNQDHLRAAYLMDQLNLRDAVDGIIYSAQLGMKKPDPGFFIAAAKTVGHAPQALLLVDDTRPNVLAARAQGWHAVHWDRSETLSAILARYAGS